MRYRRLLLLGCLLTAGCSQEDVAQAVPQGAAVRDDQGLEYRADTRVLESFPVQLHTRVTITNPGTAPVSFTLPDGCAVLLRAYRSAADAQPAFDQQRVAVCTMALQEVRLAAGESRSFNARSDAREILGDSLPDGVYHLRALVRPDGGSLEVPAGSVELAVPR